MNGSSVAVSAQPAGRTSLITDLKRSCSSFMSVGDIGDVIGGGLVLVPGVTSVPLGVVRGGEGSGMADTIVSLFVRGCVRLVMFASVPRDVLVKPRQWPRLPWPLGEPI